MDAGVRVHRRPRNMDVHSPRRTHCHWSAVSPCCGPIPLSEQPVTCVRLITLHCSGVEKVKHVCAHQNRHSPWEKTCLPQTECLYENCQPWACIHCLNITAVFKPALLLVEEPTSQQAVWQRVPAHGIHVLPWSP